ncbi:double C2-like domain-containing protein gamma isoform X9 [Alexandromys fortis]|uniref:double C2-like domain-containing protein gamma isoform X9 n=1 Tax=Alexandromys fortis TaxID=100897 RepID=UPI0021529E6B|nr:double C2-like domain-containing protein gamma isoform X9 [Microtus fortis]XP_049992712.1 double C2-like domain-containing protein gamma isoform X9 [Microtus fortis]
MACAGPAGGRQRVSMQEHMAIDVSPGPIQPIRLISDYFPHFYPFLEPVLRAPGSQTMLAPAIHSASQLQPNPEPEGDSDDSTALGTLEFTLLFDADNSTLHCTAHRAKVRMKAAVLGWDKPQASAFIFCFQGLKPLASGSVDTYVKANLLPGAIKASQLRTRTVRGTRGPVWEETLTYHGFTYQDAGRKTLRLCVCEDSRLRRRRAPPLGELRVPLRKLVPNQARSFDICLEKRRLTKRPKSLDTARGMSLYEEGSLEMRNPRKDLQSSQKIGRQRTSNLEAEPERRRWRQKCLGKNVGVSSCPYATAPSVVACWWACCAVPTWPPWMPMATRIPLSAFSCIQVLGRDPNTRPVFGERP